MSSAALAAAAARSVPLTGQERAVCRSMGVSEE